MSDGQNPTRQAMIDVVRETLDFITGDAYYSNSFASPIMDAIWPLVEAYRAEGVAEGREQAAKAIGLARAAVEDIWQQAGARQSVGIVARLSGFDDAIRAVRGDVQ